MLCLKKVLGLASLTLILLGICAGNVFAADYAPLYFESLVDTTSSIRLDKQDSAKQQDYWDELMKYKIFGAHGIKFAGQKIKIPDESGWFGTAAGDFDMSGSNLNHTVGGPVMVGGNMILSNGYDTLSSGPVRILGNVTMGYGAWPSSSVNGYQCIKGTVASEYANVIESGKAFVGSDYDNCPASVPNLNDSLRIPALYNDCNEYLPAVSADNSTKNIDVPSGAGTYDLYLEKISFSNNASINIRMPAGGRLTRIFVRDGFQISGHPKVRVQYMSSDATYDISSRTWTSGTATSVENIDYSGNLLFYTTADIYFPAISSQDSIQGTFITTGTISIQQHMTLAGQLLADYISLNSEFDGSGFRYVPFDPPILDPKLFSTLDFPENDSAVEIPVTLSKDTKVDVHFNYCFVLSKSAVTNGKTTDQYADASDFNGISPVCGVDTGRVEILADTRTASAATRIMLNVKKDDTIESYITNNCPSSIAKTGNTCIAEILELKVMNLEGAVLDGNLRDGSFYLNVIDKDVVPQTADTTYVINEDENIIFNKVTIPYTSDVNSEMAGIIIKTVPSAGSLTYFGKTVKDTLFVPVDSLGKLVYFGGANQYDTLGNGVFTTFKFAVVAENGGVSADKGGYNVITIDVKPVNDSPIVKPATYAISGHVIKGGDKTVLTGSITVMDVDDDSFTYAFDSTDANFAVVDSLFAIDVNTGAMHVKEGIELNENISKTQYQINVVVSDKSASTGNADDILSAVSKVTIVISYKNDSPEITQVTPSIDENSEAGTVVDTLDAVDPNAGDSVKVFTLVNKSDYFEVSSDGVITVKQGAKIDYEKKTSETLKVKVCDEYDACSTTDIVVAIGNIPNSVVDIVEGSNSQSTWENPVKILTNVATMELKCSFDNAKESKLCMDTTLVEGCQDLIVSYDNPYLDGADYDTVTVCLSTATPVVTVSANDNGGDADNIYTIAESTDENDTNIYVNSLDNPIKVTVKDPSNPSNDTSFTVKLKLDTAGVSSKTLSTIADVAKSEIVLDENRESVRTPVNGDAIEVSYEENVDGVTVTVSYMTDDNGNVVKTPVINDKGKLDSIEVITITYVTKVGNKEVEISYKADAVTGEVLVMDSNGNLYTEDGAKKKSVDAEPYRVSYDYVDGNGNSVTISYGVDKSGDIVKSESGDIGYSVSYTYTNEYGNSATQSVFIVLDQVGPTVEITSPEDGEVVRANSVNVVWTVNGVVQDTLTKQSLEKGMNEIVRFYKDKAGNITADTIYVVMKDAKNISLTVEQPVTEITKDKVEEYYASNPPEEGETFAVSIRNPSTGTEVETQIGGSFDTKSGSGDSPYPDVADGTHLGPALAMDIKLPVVTGVGGLATLDDLVGSDGLVSLEGVDASNCKKVSVEEYVKEYCDGDVKASDLSETNLYNTKMDVKIWIYTSLGNFVDYYRFSQNLNDPSYTDEAGLLQMYFELKPDANGDVHTENGRMLATGAYVYKVETKMKSTLRCTIPPVDDSKGKKKGDIVKTSEDLLKSFGYKRPASK